MIFWSMERYLCLYGRKSRAAMSSAMGKEAFGYMHGGDVYRNPVEYDFSVNINPLGMPPKSLEAAQNALLLCGRYPDWQGEALCKALAQAEGVKPEQIILGNGAAELIYALCFFLYHRKFRQASAEGKMITCGAGRKEENPPALRLRKGLVTAPSFGEYEAALTAAGGQVTFWNRREENAFRLEADFLKAVTQETGILFLCNPNNPTGSLIDHKLLLEIAQKCEETGTCFCLDECFLPFLEQERELSLKGALKQFPHLIILRAFTKIYGMPGLRLGYAMTADEDLLHGMRSCMQPWNTSVPAQAAGIEALWDRGYLERTRRLIAEEREYLTGELKAGLAERVYPSDADFIFFRSRPDLRELLLEEKVLIRACSNYRNLTEGYFRIGIRTHEENQELIRRWRRKVGSD